MNKRIPETQSAPPENPRKIHLVRDRDVEDRATINYDLGRDIMRRPHDHICKTFQGMLEGLLITINDAKKQGDANRIMELSNALIYFNLARLHFERALRKSDDPR